MTSRVEAVAKRLRERADDVFSWRDNDHGIDDQTWLQIAQAAIEANDAWLEEHGFAIGLSPHRRGGPIIATDPPSEESDQ